MRFNLKFAAFGLVALVLVFAALEGLASVAEKMSDSLRGPPKVWRLPEDLGFQPDQQITHLDKISHANAGGYSGPYFPPERRPDTYRIALMGDSMSFGFGVEYDESWPAIVAAELQRRARDGLQIELLNFSVPGYNTYLEWLHYRTTVRKYAPDFAWLGYFPNDAIMDRHTPNPALDCPVELPARTRLIARAIGVSALLRVLHDGFYLLFYGQLGFLEGHSNVMNPDFYGFKCSMYYLESWRGELNAARTPLTIIQIPFLADAQYDYDPEKEAQNVLERELTARQFRTINLYPAVALKDGRALMLRDTHPNAAGHRLFAAAIIARLPDLGLPDSLWRSTDAQP